MRRFVVLASLLCIASLDCTVGQQAPLSKTVQRYVRVDSPRTVLQHVRVIDGTGKAAVDDQDLIIERGKIAAVQATSNVAATKDTTVLDLHGYSVMPGIVGMHNHLFYISTTGAAEGFHREPPLFLRRWLSLPRGFTWLLVSRLCGLPAASRRTRIST
jgi:hypothetical protein